ncbi:hypothetical protein MPER_03256, partial [Moniliophthora perniciosa FA553]
LTFAQTAAQGAGNAALASAPSASASSGDSGAANETSHHVASMPPPPAPRLDARVTLPASSGTQITKSGADPHAISAMVNASRNKATYRLYQNSVVHMGSAGTSGVATSVPNVMLYPSATSGVMPMSRPRADGLGPIQRPLSSNLHAQQSQRYQRMAYAPSGDLLFIKVSIAHCVVESRGNVVELSDLGDSWPNYDAHSSIDTIRRDLCAYAGEKLRKLAGRLTECPAFLFFWDEGKFNMRDITRDSGKKAGAGVDLDSPTVHEKWDVYMPYLWAVHGRNVDDMGKKSKAKTKWVANKTLVVLRVLISAREWERFEDRVDKYNLTRRVAYQRFATWIPMTIALKIVDRCRRSQEV